MKLYKLYTLFSANTAFPLHVVLLISKNFNLNIHALLVVPFATAAVVCHKISINWLNIIMKVGFRTDTRYTLFFNKQRFFSTQPQCCLTFSWIELQMLLRRCLNTYKDYHSETLYLCSFLDLGLESRMSYLCDHFSFSSSFSLWLLV